MLLRPSRLRHLEEVDILRCLSSPVNDHVIAFVDAWEQNRQLFIQTELCELGNLAFFLEEYGRLVPRLDESRVWKIVRELSDVSVPILLVLRRFAPLLKPSLHPRRVSTTSTRTTSSTST